MFVLNLPDQTTTQTAFIIVKPGWVNRKMVAGKFVTSNGDALLLSLNVIYIKPTAFPAEH